MIRRLVAALAAGPTPAPVVDVEVRPLLPFVDASDRVGMFVPAQRGGHGG